jgi:hypothetical protein
MRIQLKLKPGKPVDPLSVLDEIYSRIRKKQDDSFIADLDVIYLITEKVFLVKVDFGLFVEEFKGPDLSELIKKAVEFVEDALNKIILAEF